jgi:hypothetical protein
MSGWAVVSAAYGIVLAVAALAQPVSRKPLVLSVTIAYALVALGAGTLPTIFWVQLLAPAALLLMGYWISGFFFRAPQEWLERLLLDSDRRVFALLRFDPLLQRAPRWVLEGLEASYAADYAVVGAGALIAASSGIAAVSFYWTVVLAAELSCYVTLPWLRSRPPRAVEPAGTVARRRPLLRRLNVAILDRASVQANTLPSGHVAGAVAAALAVWPIDAGGAVVLMVLAVLITIAAAACRYHYVIDCVTGIAVAVVAWAIVPAP